MRKLYKIYSFLIAFTLLFTGCEDLDQGTKGVLATDSYYSDAGSLEAGLMGIYGHLHRETWALEYQGFGAGADDITTRPGSNKWVVREGDQFAKTGGNSWFIDSWDGYYRTILLCNLFLRGAQTDALDEAELNNYRADAHFVRALCYYRLAAVYGDIPMPLDPEPDVSIGYTDKRDVMTQVISDFEFALKWKNNERDSNPMVNDMHSSKTAAKAYLAKVYMTLTGWPYNEEDKWTQVKQYTQEIINEGVYSLVDDFAFNFQSPHQINQEVIFSHICDKVDGNNNLQNRAYGYKWANWVDAFVEWDFFNKFPEGWRKKFSVSADTEGNDNPAHDGLIELWDHPFVVKYNYGTIKGRDEFEHVWQTTNDNPAMRFSEVLLMYSEACFRSGETAEALEKFNWVRRRAYAKNAQSQEDVAALPAEFWKEADADIDLTNTDDFINKIVRERACEFIGEISLNYWLDLMRLEMVGDANSNRDTRELPMIGDPYDKNLWFAPIPDTEKVLNPNLQ